MRVFVTGASGFVGSAIVAELLAAGHQVLGLARSDNAAAAIEAAGATAHRGSLDDLDSLHRGVDGADAVIHTAFNHDFSRFRASCEEDRQVIEALGAALVGTTRPLIITSGIGILTPGAFATEATPAPSGPNANPRVATEEAADAVAARGVHVAVVRLAPSVHGDGDHGFVPMLINIAREKGAAAFIGDGANRWTAVHRLDAAHLYRRVLEAGTAGARYHAVAEEGVPFRDIAAVIGRRLNVPIVGLNHDEAAAHFGTFAHFAGLDVPASSAQTRAQLGWQPTQIGLLADIDGPEYFAG